VYHENEKLYQKNAELYHDQEGNLHNKNNKIKQEDIYIAQSDFQKVLSALEELCGPVAMDTTRLINTWLEKHPLERIQQAIDVAGERRARSPKYIDQVLISWEENGYPPSRAQQIFARAFKPRRGKNGEDKPRYEIPEYSEAELATIAEINRMSDL
jgi:DnaD/phage-associated family protein